MGATKKKAKVPLRDQVNFKLEEWARAADAYDTLSRTIVTDIISLYSSLNQEKKKQVVVFYRSELF